MHTSAASHSRFEAQTSPAFAALGARHDTVYVAPSLVVVSLQSTPDPQSFENGAHVGKQKPKPALAGNVLHAWLVSQSLAVAQ